MTTSMTHRYIPRMEQTEENLFLEEYYSSTDTKIYMDDIEQTEIAYINYSLQEQLKPIYGYASRTFDDVAIGNRIVTGMMKVSIKNTQAQTPESEVKANSAVDTLGNYNEQQQQLADAVDWITGDMNQFVDADAVITEDDTTFEYHQKLIILGYDLDTNSGETKLRQAIKQFQKDNGIEANGKLTSSTQYAIDKAIMTSSTVSKVIIEAGTHIYNKPTKTSGSRVLSEPQEAYVISKDFDGWLQIRTVINGWEGYVVAGEVSS